MSEALTVQIDPRTRRRLAAMAQREQSSESALAAEAIAAYVDSDAWQRREIREAIHEADAGHTIDHARVVEWLRTWGTDNELPPPK